MFDGPCLARDFCRGLPPARTNYRACQTVPMATLSIFGHFWKIYVRTPSDFSRAPVKWRAERWGRVEMLDGKNRSKTNQMPEAINPHAPLASPTGLEPVTPNLEGSCSIRMSYGLCAFILRAERGRLTRARRRTPQVQVGNDPQAWNQQKKPPSINAWRLLDTSWSGRKDSNLRPSGPKPDALPGCATPRLRVF